MRNEQSISAGRGPARRSAGPRPLPWALVMVVLGLMLGSLGAAADDRRVLTVDGQHLDLDSGRIDPAPTRPGRWQAGSDLTLATDANSGGLRLIPAPEAAIARLPLGAGRALTLYDAQRASYASVPLPVEADGESRFVVLTDTGEAFALHAQPTGDGRLALRYRPLAPEPAGLASARMVPRRY